MKRIGASLPFAARGARAFTLIEVLVSCAVIGIVMFILLTTLSSSLTLWRTAEGNIAADREGRSANFLLAQDLANAVVLSNSSFWPQATSNSLRFLTLRPADYQSDSNAVGDLCFVEYRVVQDTNTSNTNFLALTRNFVSSGETYEALKGGSFPSVPAANAQILAANIVPNRRVLYFNTEISDTHFAVLGADGKPMTGSTVPPAMIDVTISTADEETVRSLDLTNKQVRKAGFYSFRQALRAP
ncbi:MAG: prepilin-type N-terminal cleavage/methylation domain-containing protein [Chthoniobacterales bacterium]|nr:prepilin-type N-terminal cleavage/methylation domain-containing protein [Chthoniobacterales bacterium]